VSSLTGDTIESKQLSVLHMAEIKHWVKNVLYPRCPLLNGDTYDNLSLHEKLGDFLKMSEVERLEHKVDMRRWMLRQVEQHRHNAKTAVQRKIKGKMQKVKQLLLAKACTNYCYPARWKLATWYDNGKRFDKTLIGWIRRGNYAEAKKDVKELWQVICLDLMPTVVAIYKKEVQMSARLSEVVTNNQEVFVLWLLQTCYATWAEQWKKDADYMDEHGTKPPRRSKPKGQANFATAQGKEYLELLDIVTQARKSEESGLGWEEPLLAVARDKYSKEDGGSKSGSTNRAAKRAKLIFPVIGI